MSSYSAQAGLVVADPALGDLVADSSDIPTTLSRLVSEFSEKSRDLVGVDPQVRRASPRA